MYDILVFLFENCHQAELASDRERVARKLSAAGFEHADISEALHWLAGVLRAPQQCQSHQRHAGVRELQQEKRIRGVAEGENGKYPEIFLQRPGELCGWNAWNVWNPWNPWNGVSLRNA